MPNTVDVNIDDDNINYANKEFALTTIDNPFDPFKQFSDWFAYDIHHDYGCCALLDRFANTSDDMAKSEYQRELSRAIDDILIYDFEGIYKKVSRTVEDD